MHRSSELDYVRIRADYYFSHEFGGPWHVVSPDEKTLCGVKFDHDQIAMEILRRNVCDECFEKLDLSLYEIIEWKLPDQETYKEPSEEVKRQAEIYLTIRNILDHLDKPTSN